MGRISSKETRRTFSKGVGSGGDKPVLIWGVFLVLCFGSQIHVACGVAMEGTISCPLWLNLCQAFCMASCNAFRAQMLTNRNGAGYASDLVLG